MKLKKYLLGRAESMTAWIGMIGFALEILLHLGHSSTIMLALFVLLVVLPEDSVRKQFAEWTQELKDSAK